jgi:TAT-translocated FGD2 family F420-dependent dehydrogenase
MDNQGNGGHAWITLAALGQRLERIPMGTGVTCPTYRYHPAIVAQAFASLGVLYPGRVFLGVGSGEAINEEAVTNEWGDYDERSERMAEAIIMIRQLWTGEWSNFDNKYYPTKDVRLYNVPKPGIPILVAAGGESSMELAGMHGDGLISDAEALTTDKLRDAFETGARAAGKRPEDMPLCAESFVFVGDETKADDAAELWRFITHAWDKYVDYADPRAILEDAKKNVDLDEVKKQWVIGADAKTHIESIQKQAEAGVTHIFIHSGQEDQEMVIDFYKREVLPNIDHEIMQPNDMLVHEMEV